MKTKLFFVIALLLSLSTNAQETPPEVSRFLQVNTYNGGQLSHISVDDKSNGYICGIANGKNFNFDGFAISPVGLDDLFVVKINSEGQNQWIRTVNASDNGIISCSKSFINPLGEVYVSGSFSGNITFGGKNYYSVGTSASYYLLKYDLNGNESWIIRYPSPVVDIATENNNTFVTYGQNHIAKLDDTTGEISNIKSFLNLNIKALEIKNNKVYIAGQANQFESFGSESVYQNNGFVLKTDLDFNVSDLVRFVPAGWNQYYISSINDIRFLSDGSLAIVGVSSNKVLFGMTDTNNFSANNDTNFTTNGGYILLVKINENLDNLHWFLTGTNMSSNFNMNVVDDRIANLEIFPYGSSWFRVLLKKKFDNFQQYNLPTGLTATSDDKSVMFAVSFTGADYGGTFATSKDQYYTYGISNNNANSLFLNYNKSNSNAYVFNDSATWGKFILNSEFGTLSSNYIKHTGADGSLINYTYQCGKANYFGSLVDNLVSCSNIISKISPDGKPIWKSQLIATTQTSSTQSREGNIADTNSAGESVFVSHFTNLAKFVDPNNLATDFTRQDQNVSNFITLISNTKADGTLKWAKKIEPTTEGKKITYSSVTYDHNGNVVIAGTTNDTFLVDDLAYNFNKKEVLFLMKLDGDTGNVLFAKQFTDMGAYMLNLDTDNENNIYLSYEPILYNGSATSYSFGSVQVPLSPSGLNQLFLKFDSNGNTLLGKNFYANNSSSDYNYSWPLSLKFDGANFIISGEIYSQNKILYKGLDGQSYTNPYPTYNISDFIAKVDKSGNVIWHKPIYATKRIHQNKADVDEFGNVYYYFGALEKINVDGNETQFDNANYSAGLLKLSATDGALKYIKNLGIHKNYLYNSSLSVLQNDILSFSGNADRQHEFLYPIKNHNNSNYYIATLGKLPTPYLTPESNYLLVSNIEVPNSITNTGEFDLITNVDWTATSNQSWLTLSAEKLALKNQTSANISASGDHKISLNATQNLTGTTRSAIITIAGNGVANKEILVTQSGTLGITEIKERTLLVYPNPTSDSINFSKEMKEISIFDSLGRLIKNGKAISNINISDLPSAIYMVKTTDKHGVSQTTKVIKK